MGLLGEIRFGNNGGICSCRDRIFYGFIPHANDLTKFVGNNRPHNEYLQYALFYGIPAGVLYFLGCFSIYLHALKFKDRLNDVTLAALTAAFGYLVGAFFGLTVYNTAPYLFIMMGLGYVQVKDSTIIPADNSSVHPYTE